VIEALWNRFRRVHMIGIGGSGMSGIAEILLRSGFQVSGCDLGDNEATHRLSELGAIIANGHSPSHLKGVDAVIYSSAVRDEHPELVMAHQRKIPIIPRAEMLAELMRMKAGVAISGTHGKTTTTSLTGAVLTAGGLAPTVLVGGRLCQVGTGAVSGAGEFLVAEADEFDRSFLRLTPTMVVVTNIDNDHIECYGSFEALEAAFVQFANSVPFYGRAIVCLDEPSVVRILPRLNRTVVTYGISSQAEVRAEEVEYTGALTSFTIVNGDGKRHRIRLPLPGRHNVLNALAAAAIGRELGVSLGAIKTALEGFKGVHRRFEIIGEAGGRMVVDDFGHHPTEIAATLTAARTGWGRPITVVFQPHLFSRTLDLAPGFGQALMRADTALVLPIYPAREDPIEGVTSRLIVDAAKALGHQHIYYLEDKSRVAQEVKRLTQPGDMILTVGAGDVNRLAPQILEALRE
jgi:UDP-N-acetylmuramate--alanine ligase